MKYRILGKTGLRVSVIGIGTWQLGGEWARAYTQAEVDAILDTAMELGINVIDTAECYGDHLSERFIGDYLSRRDRSQWIVGTKFGHHYEGFNQRSWSLKPSDVSLQLEASLRALRLDTVDLYQFHSGTDEDFQNPELWELLRQQQQQGKIRHLGISISSKSGPLQAEHAAAAGADMLQLLYNRLDRRAEQDFFPVARRDHLGVWARVPLASGILSGRYVSPQFAPDDVRSTFDQTKLHGLISETERLRQEEVPAGVTLSHWALAWCLRSPEVHCVIPGCKNPQQVIDNAAAAGLVSD